MNNHHPELFHRHKLNPILTAADWPYPVNSVFQPRRDAAARWHDPAVVPRGGSARAFPLVRRPLRQWRG